MKTVTQIFIGFMILFILASTISPDIFLYAQEYEILDDTDQEALTFYEKIIHNLYSGSVLIMDKETKMVLFEYQGYMHRYPASITKIMTALLVLEHVDDFDAVLTFSPTAMDIPWYASRMWVEEGEEITILEAMYGIMLPSGNEVAWALAEYVSGSIDVFVIKMNERARSLGAYDTRFINPCGLPGDEQWTTAYDMALIMREATQWDLFNEIIATEFFYVQPTNIYPLERRIRNTNQMIRDVSDHYNAAVIGGKTGFTNAARHTLMTYALVDGRYLIIAALYAPSGGTFIDTNMLIDVAPHFFNILKYADTLTDQKDETTPEYAECDDRTEDIDLNDEYESIISPYPVPPIVAYDSDNDKESKVEPSTNIESWMLIVAGASFLMIGLFAHYCYKKHQYNAYKKRRISPKIKKRQ